MDSEKYVNYYIEALTGTLNEAVIRTISLQTNARITNEVIEEQRKTLDTLKNELETYKKTQQEKNQTEVSSLQSTISSKDGVIADLRQQLANLDKMRSEYDNVKHQVQHVDTFRNELVKERELHQKTRNEFENRIKELSDQIEYLQLTPAKRKKVDESRATNKVETVVVQPETVTVTEDGGSF
jgi:chromosome segregation ATPase